MHKRIQRKRVRGWKMKPNTVYVGRTTKWGNPFFLDDYPAKEAVDKFRFYIGYPYGQLGFEPEDLEELRGKDLACWCQIGSDHPFHADVLLELANT